MGKRPFRTFPAKRPMRTFFPCFPICLLGICLVSACSSTRRTEHFYAHTLCREIEHSPVFAQSFTGFTLLDPETGRLLCDVNGGQHFTPASCTKILTLATCLEVLKDSVPRLRYYPVPEGSTHDNFFYLGWIVAGAGDPTFFHPKFQAWQTTTLEDLKKNGLIGIVRSPQKINRLGAGWAWDDYSEGYSPELSELPLYGNVTQLTKIGYGWQITPTWYQRFLETRDNLLDEKNIFRQEQGDTISLPNYSEDIFAPGFSKTIPVWQANDKAHRLLLDTLAKIINRPLEVKEGDVGDSWRTYYATPLDTVLRRMMYQSDNFIAEQLLLACAGVKYDTLRQDKIIQWAKDSLFSPPITRQSSSSLPPSPGKSYGGQGHRRVKQSTNQLVNQSPRWVDGSGLSRYNLVSPRYLTNVLWKLWQEQPHDRLLSLFPTTGAPETTLSWWEPIPAVPWLFAKTGSMGGVVCISGYLRTRRGKTLIFSFMNNNFVGSAKPWRLEMRRILELVAG